MLTGRFTPGSSRPSFEAGDLRLLDPLWQRERYESGLRIAALLGDVAARLGRTTAQVAIAWVLAQQGVAAALTGPSRFIHLTENAGACGWRLP
jgi:aryl-alcohol dehydrogenase-like predicted oxidoreductase